MCPLHPAWWCGPIYCNLSYQKQGKFETGVRRTRFPPSCRASICQSLVAPLILPIPNSCLGALVAACCGEDVGHRKEIPPCPEHRVGIANPPWLALGSPSPPTGLKHEVSMVRGQKGKSLDGHSAAGFNRCAPKPEDFPDSTDPQPGNKPEALPDLWMEVLLKQPKAELIQW